MLLQLKMSSAKLHFLCLKFFLTICEIKVHKENNFAQKMKKKKLDSNTVLPTYIYPHVFSKGSFEMSISDPYMVGILKFGI